jgi:hypothetical protein
MSMPIPVSSDETSDRTSTNRTDLCAYLVATLNYRVLRIEGPPYSRRFCLDKEITVEDTTRFYTSNEKRVLDQFRALKSAVAAT